MTSTEHFISKNEIKTKYRCKKQTPGSKGKCVLKMRCPVCHNNGACSHCDTGERRTHCSKLEFVKYTVRWPDEQTHLEAQL